MIVIDCGEIILFVILFVVFVVMRSILDMLICCVVMVCKFENSVFVDVLDFVRNMLI